MILNKNMHLTNRKNNIEMVNILYNLLNIMFHTFQGFILCDIIV